MLATNDVKLFDNKIIDNKTSGTAIISYFMTEEPIADKEYDPYSRRIYICNNYYQKPRSRPTMRGRMGKMYRFKLRFVRGVTLIVYDGILPAKGTDEQRSPTDAFGLCMQDNENATFAYIDAAGGFLNITQDIDNYNCSLPPLAQVPTSAV